MKHYYSFLVLSLFVLSLLTVFGSLSVKADDSYVIKFGYKDNEWTQNSEVGQESCAGTISNADKIITGSDFYFSGRHDEAFKRYDDEWTGVNGASNNNAGVKACTRESKTVVLPAGTYTFKLLSKNTENATLTLPKIILGSDEYTVTDIIVDESSQSFSNNQYNYTGGKETTLCYGITLSSAYNGTVSVEFKDGWKEKYLFKTLTISSSAPAAQTYEVSATASNGTVSGTGSFQEGATVTLEASPVGNYAFSGWSNVSGISILGHENDNPLTFTMPANAVSVTADFAACTTHTVTLTAGANGSVSGGGKQCDGSVTVTATPNSGYRFVNWTNTSNSEEVSTDAEYTFDLSADISLTANFDLIICQSSRTYQVEDIMITTDGAVTNHDTQATSSNVMIITSENKNNYSNADAYLASISDGAFVYNRQAESAVYMEVDVPRAGNYTLDVYSGKGQDKNVWVNVYTTTSGSGDHISYGGTTYYKQYNTQLNKDYSEYKIKLSDKKDGTGVDDKEYPAGKCIIGIYTGTANCALDKIVLTRVNDTDVFCKHTITVNSTSGASSSAIANKSMALSGETVTVTAPAASSGYSFTGWTALPAVTFADETALSTTFVMPDEDITLTANYALDGLTISSLPWNGSQDLAGQTIVSAEAFSCFDTELTFTFTGDGTVQYYDNTNRETSLGTITSGTAIALNDDLRAHGIYIRNIRSTDGAATLTAVSKTTIGSVYEIWSGAVEVRNWEQQVVLGPEHFQTAKVGDVLRVHTSDEGGDAQGALQYIYTDSDSHTYKGLDNSDGEGLRDWPLSDGDKGRHYFEIEINETHLANLKRYGVIVKGSYYTIQSVELRASCSNQAMRTSAPDVTTYGDDESIDIMTNRLVLDGEGFDLGNWEHKVELYKNCFGSVTVGSIINFYMKVQDGATLSFRCNVDSIHAESYQDNPPRCPSYGDISFDRTIHNLYGDEPQLIGQNKGYRVLSLLVDEDMLTRLKETGMILCGKGAFIKIVEGVPNPFVVNSGEEKEIPTVVNNLEIYQGGQAANKEDIQVLGNITYFRPAQGGYLNNKLNTWYTFTLPFEVNKVEVYDETYKEWFDINAVYYSNDDINQDANNPNGPGHYYLQYLSKQEYAAVRDSFITRWQYITPGHSLECASQWGDVVGTRYGYPKKNEAYIILFDSERPIGSYFQTNTQVRYVGGPQTISGRDSLRTVVSDGYEYWMYANNTLHSFTFEEEDAYILNEEGTYFILQSNPTIRPFECYVQATESLKAKYAALPMRGFNIEDNTPTGAESIQGSAIRAEKILRNGQLIIIRNGVEYDATGVVIR